MPVYDFLQKNMRILIPLLKLDSFFAEDIYVLGEEIYDNEGIEKVMELYKGKALVTLKDGNKSEIRFNKDNIVDISCTCTDFKIKKVCQHIVAASFEIRKIALKFEEKEVIKRPGRKRETNDLFNELLEILDKNELAGFLSGYAMKDKNFRLIFEAFFLNRLKNRELDNPYGKLLDEVLPPSSDIEIKFSRQQISLLIDISKDLLNRFKDEISLKKYTDAFNIIRHLINKLSYASNKNNNEQLANLMNEAHEALSLIFMGEIAPELKSRQYDFIYDMIGKSYYFYQNKSDLIHLFLSSNPLREDLNNFVDVLRNKILVIRDEDARKYFMAFYVGLKKQLNSLEEDWYESNFKDLSDFMDIALSMLNEGFASQLDELLTELYSKEKISKRLFLESQLRICITLNDCERVGFLTHSIYESTLDFRFIKRTQKCIPNFSSEIISKLGEIIKNKAEEEDILMWWVLTKNLEELINYLSEKNDINLIQKYENEILDKDERTLGILYKNYIHSYLDVHFGEKSASVVKNLLTHLKSIGARKISSLIENDLNESYSNRKNFLRSIS